MIQTILSDMDSEAVSAWNDTEESKQVATIIRTTYFDLAARLNLPEHKDVFKLEHFGSDAEPVLMTLPSFVVDLEWIKYDKQQDGDTAPNWEPVTYLSLSNFVDHVQQFNEDDDEVLVMSVNTDCDILDIPYKNDKAPTYYTQIDDTTLLFDSHDAAVDTDSLDVDKTWCYGLTTNTFTFKDGTIPDMDVKLFPLLLSEATSACFAKLKQMQSVHDEKLARRHLIASQKNKFNVPKGGPSSFSQLPNYGRK
jgi:hypothetical protein